jgi:hypothetical protein
LSDEISTSGSERRCSASSPSKYKSPFPRNLQTSTPPDAVKEAYFKDYRAGVYKQSRETYGTTYLTGRLNAFGFDSGPGYENFQFFFRELEEAKTIILHTGYDVPLEIGDLNYLSS